MSLAPGSPLAHCGYVALVGRPNAGKSTLLNRILGQKLSITSHKPQTTRHSILGIKTEAESQVVYVDTPGIHPSRGRAINRLMNRTASNAFRDVDVIVMIVEGQRWGEEEQLILEHLERVEVPVILAINKIDRIRDKSRLLPLIAALAERYPFREIVPISALKGRQVERLEAVVTALLPAAPALFSEEQVTDRSERFLAAEIVRERLMRQLDQELPYALTVEIESFHDAGERLEIAALIWVERKAQKAIVIGRDGQQLKRVGSQARETLEKILGRRVHLELWVKVKEGWSDDERALRSLGYEE